MEDLCRICRKRCLYNSTYIHSSHDGVSVSEMLIKTCPIDITSDDPIGQLLPQSICNDCFEVISAAFNLQRVCIESDQYFRSMIGSDQIKVKEEVFEQLMDIKEEEMDLEEYLDNITTTQQVMSPKPVRKKRKRSSDEEAENNENKEKIFHPRAFNKAAKYDDVFYFCNFCHAKLRPRKTVLRHMLEKHDPQSLPFYCKYCDQRFKDELEKEVHEQTHNPTDKLVLVCKICTATGTREVGMQQHMIDDHNLFDLSKSPVVNFQLRALPSSETPEADDIMYACNFCDKKINRKVTMLRHLMEHHPIAYPFGCEFCSLRFDNRHELELHVQESHNEDSPKVTLFCDLCGVSSDNKEGMQHHIEDDHLGGNKKSSRKKMCAFRCNFCRAKFMERKGLNNHLLTVHKETTKCEKCDEEFDNKRDMNNHMAMVHSKLYRQVDPHDVETILKCCKCERNHSTEAELMEHVVIHKPQINERTKCFLCPKILKNYSIFLEHAKYHAQPKTHECLTCKRRFPFGKRLMRHVRNHKRYDQYKAECQKCSQKFTSQKDLENHDKIKHQNETLFMCPICAKSLSSATGVDSHIRFVHNKEQESRFHCRFCPMKFIHKTKLTRHEAIHSTERPHVCEICGSSFKMVDGLLRHMKIHDPNQVRNFECTQCPKKFPTKYKLDLHSYTHSGLKPHECQYCDRAYALKGDLTKHQQKMHLGKEIYPCEKCPRKFRLMVELREHQQEHIQF